MLVRCRNVRRKVAAALGRPQRPELSDDPVCELVAGMCQTEGDVRVQALEPGRAGPRTTYTGLELGPQATLLRVRARDAPSELGIELERARPALDPAGGLQPRHPRHELRTAQPVRRGKRIAAIVERRLLHDGRSPEWTAHDNTTKRAWAASELTFENGEVIGHASRS